MSTAKATTSVTKSAYDQHKSLEYVAISMTETTSGLETSKTVVNASKLIDGTSDIEKNSHNHNNSRNCHIFKCSRLLIVGITAGIILILVGCHHQTSNSFSLSSLLSIDYWRKSFHNHFIGCNHHQLVSSMTNETTADANGIHQHWIPLTKDDEVNTTFYGFIMSEDHHQQDDEDSAVTARTGDQWVPLIINNGRDSRGKNNKNLFGYILTSNVQEEEQGPISLDDIDKEEEVTVRTFIHQDQAKSDTTNENPYSDSRNGAKNEIKYIGEVSVREQQEKKLSDP
jgi:hypothetical protein